MQHQCFFPLQVFILLLVFAAGTVCAQSSTATLSSARIAAHYYDIDFTPTQYEQLAGKEIELILVVDSFGRAELTGVNPDMTVDVQDSLYRRTLTLPRLYGEGAEAREESMYTIWFTYPQRNQGRYVNPYWDGVAAYSKAQPEDFEYLELSKARLELSFGTNLVQPLAARNNYLHTGAGGGMEIGISDNKGRLYGLFMQIAGNKRKQDLPIATGGLTPLSAPLTLSVGALYGRYAGNWSIKASLGVGQTNLTDGDPDEFLHTDGVTLGLRVDRLLYLGTGDPEYAYAEPMLARGSISPHLALRYFHASIPEFRGPSLEVGIAYRIQLFGVDRYKLRE